MAFGVKDDSFLAATAGGSSAITAITGATENQVMVGAADGSIESDSGFTYDGTTVTLGSTQALSVAADADATTLLGRCRIASPSSDQMYIGHYDNTGDSAGFRQLANGQTYVQSSGFGVIMRPNGNVCATFNPTAITFSYAATFQESSADNAQFTRGTPAAEDTTFWVAVYNGASWDALQRVSCGADDSGGAGYKVLRVAN